METGHCQLCDMCHGVPHSLCELTFELKWLHPSFFKIHSASTRVSLFQVIAVLSFHYKVYHNEKKVTFSMHETFKFYRDQILRWFGHSPPKEEKPETGEGNMLPAVSQEWVLFHG